MARTMYDSVNANAIPTNAPMVAGYIDGVTYKWTDSDWARFPNSVKVRIARRTYTNDGHVLDVESGIPTVWPLTDPSVRQGIRNWVRMRRDSGVTPTIYCNELNDWGPVKQIFAEVGMAQPLYWVARYNNVREIPSGAIARQYANPPLAGGHYDLSIVANYWPGVDAEEDEMELTDSVGTVRMADGENYNLTVKDILWGLAQYIQGNGTAGNGLTAHPQGQYNARILSISDIKSDTNSLKSGITAINTNLASLNEAVQNLAIAPVDVPALANAIVAELGPDLAHTLANEIDRRARDNDPTTGPTS